MLWEAHLKNSYPSSELLVILWIGWRVSLIKGSVDWKIESPNWGAKLAMKSIKWMKRWISGSTTSPRKSKTWVPSLVVKWRNAIKKSSICMRYVLIYPVWVHVKPLIYDQHQNKLDGMLTAGWLILFLVCLNVLHNIYSKCCKKLAKVFFFGWGYVLVVWGNSEGGITFFQATFNNSVKNRYRVCYNHFI